MADATNGGSRKLLTPMKIANGQIELKHRVIYCPMTRLRGVPIPSPEGPDQPPRAWCPTELHAEYYSQRASDGGLLITEGIAPSQQGTGLPFVPGLYLPEQVAGWKKVTDAVHAKNGVIYAQIWHTGRVALPQNTGMPSVSASADPWGADDIYPFPIPHTGELVKYKDYPPEKLDKAGIERVISEMVHAAKNAMDAGFDGVEVHGANGYLPEQFLSSNINTRTDEYGGSPEKYPRFVLDLLAALSGAIGSHKVAIRLSPFGLCHQTRSDSRVETWSALCRGIKERADIGPISYVHFIEPRYEFLHKLEDKARFLASISGGGGNGINSDNLLEPFRKILGDTPFITAGGWNPDNCWDAVESGRADAVAFGRIFLANPDFVDRLRRGRRMNMYDRSSFYSPGEKGLIDYPTWERASETEGMKWYVAPKPEEEEDGYLEEL